MNTSHIHVDMQTCIGCRTCEVSCAVNHQTAQQSGFYPRLRVYKEARISAPAVCHQCENAACMNACPTGALVKKNGMIMPIETRCIGCKSCVLACPFGAIEIAGVAASRHVSVLKCDMCLHDTNGPACVRTCPTNALSIMTPQRLQSLMKQKQGHVV